MKKIYVIIVAGGSSSRMKGLNKLLLDVSGKSLIETTVSRFMRDDIDGIFLVSSDENIIEKVKPYKKVMGIAPAGGERSESVINGLKLVPSDSFVMIHDGARPFVSDETIEKCIVEAKKGTSFVVGVYSNDTVKYVEDGVVKETIDRRNVFLAHTPQGFPVEELRAAYKAGLTGTDDAYVMERYGVKVKAVEGNRDNVKITTREDLRYL